MLRLQRNLPFINSSLLILIILINSYLIITPFLPTISHKIKAADKNQVKELSRQVHQAPLPTHQPNSLTIPSILLDEQIHEGKNVYATLNKGIWHWPAGSTPEQGGNTVLIGHRFTYTNPKGPFYFLNKVKVEDEIGVRWNNKKYIYRVNKIEVVPPKQTEILNPSTEPTLTLYTCTPLWWPKQRLVISASLESAL